MLLLIILVAYLVASLGWMCLTLIAAELWSGDKSIGDLSVGWMLTILLPVLPFTGLFYGFKWLVKKGLDAV